MTTTSTSISTTLKSDLPKGGILLNARPNSRLQQQSPNLPALPPLTASSPSSPSSISASASASDDSVSRNVSSGGVQRRITFAPLPNPRALEDQHDLPKIVLDESYSDDQQSQSSFKAPPSPLGLSLRAIRSADSSPIIKSSKRLSSWGSTKKLFKPLLYNPLSSRPSTSPSTSISVFGSGDESNGGALGLFRSTSKDSVSDASTETSLVGSGLPLSRRKSTGSSSYLGPKTLLVPDTNSILPPSPLSPDGVAVKTAGTRLLNGRIYGAARLKTQEAQTKSAEPEFVEWGYGGMGSNQNGGSSRYARVQSGRTNVVGNVKTNEDDDDDGSGMGWVKRRREAREREKKEREERERKEQKAKEESTTPTETASQAAPSEIAPTAPVANPTPSTSTPPPQEEHITQAITIPARHHHPHHPHQLRSKPSRRSTSESKAASGATTPMAGGVSTPMLTSQSIPVQNVGMSTVGSCDSAATVTVNAMTMSNGTPTLRSVSGSPAMMEIPLEVDSPSATTSTVSDYDEEDESNGEANLEKDDDEEEDDEEEMNDEQRRTCVCAGVEKVSRHK